MTLKTHKGIIERLRELETGQMAESHEEKEDIKDKCVCDCGNDSFRIYISIIIDDARLYCSKCGKEWM